MSKNKKNYTSTQIKLFEILEKIDNGEVEDNSEYWPFDIECINEHCSAKNGKRHMATAWKLDKYRFHIFCTGCGQEYRLSREEFKEEKKRIDKEKALSAMAEKLDYQQVNYYVDGNDREIE